jgi:opacity protein-like surface antigen
VLRKISFIALLLFPALLAAQNSESAIGGEASMSAGVEMSTFNPDWGCPNIAPLGCQTELYGPTAVFNFDLHDKYGIEGEARWLHWHGNGGMVESNYFAGPRYRLYRISRFALWGKLGLGGAWITTPDYPAAGSLKGSYFAYAPGATLNFRLNRTISIRADYEYQIWPSFAGPPTYNSATGKVEQNASGLTPNGISVGVNYRILGGR